MVRSSSPLHHPSPSSSIPPSLFSLFPRNSRGVTVLLVAAAMLLYGYYLIYTYDKLSQLSDHHIKIDPKQGNTFRASSKNVEKRKNLCLCVSAVVCGCDSLWDSFSCCSWCERSSSVLHLSLMFIRFLTWNRTDNNRMVGMISRITSTTISRWRAFFLEYLTGGPTPRTIEKAHNQTFSNVLPIGPVAVEIPNSEVAPPQLDDQQTDIPVLVFTYKSRKISSPYDCEL